MIIYEAYQNKTPYREYIRCPCCGEFYPNEEDFSEDTDDEWIRCNNCGEIYSLDVRVETKFMYLTSRIKEKL